MAAVIPEDSDASAADPLSDSEDDVIGQDQMFEVMRDADDFNEQLDRDRFERAFEDENWGMEPQDEDDDAEDPGDPEESDDPDWEPNVGSDEDNVSVWSGGSGVNDNGRRQPHQDDNVIRRVGLGVYPPPLDAAGHNPRLPDLPAALANLDWQRDGLEFVNPPVAAAAQPKSTEECTIEYYQSYGGVRFEDISQLGPRLDTVPNGNCAFEAANHVNKHTKGSGDIDGE